jgi:hypothetical protein
MVPCYVGGVSSLVGRDRALSLRILSDCSFLVKEKSDDRYTASDVNTRGPSGGPGIYALVSSKSMT